MKIISDAAPQIVSTSTQLPSATAYLSDLSKMTEEGTLEVVCLAELIQDDHSPMTKELSAVVETLHGIDFAKLAKRL